MQNSLYTHPVSLADPAGSVMTELAKQIVLEAYKDLLRPCRETGENRGACVRAIQSSTGAFGLAWCGSYAVHLIDRAVAVTGATNYLPRTASAAGMLQAARNEKKLRIDTIPAPGAVFYRRSGEGASSGHIGTVLYVEPSGLFWTIEGNVSDQVASYFYKPEEIRSKGFQFMHTEEMPVTLQAQAGDIDAAIQKAQQSTIRRGGSNFASTGYLPGDSIPSLPEVDPSEPNKISASYNHQDAIAVRITAATLTGLVAGFGVGSYCYKNQKKKKKDKTVPALLGVASGLLAAGAFDYAAKG